MISASPPPRRPSFFTHAAGLSLGPEDLAVLDARLEGWVAGLQMAALSFERRAEMPRILHSLASSQSYLLDYLAEEVLNNQPDDLRRFLLAISILDRFSAPLFAAITAAAPGVSECLIEQASRANLFLAPLDAEGEWFRFHNLFTSLLRVRLKKLAPDTQSGLHVRAAAWLEAHDFLHEAIHHTLEAGDYDRAAALVERHTAALFAAATCMPCSAGSKACRRKPPGLGPGSVSRRPGRSPLPASPQKRDSSCTRPRSPCRPSRKCPPASANVWPMR